MQDQQQAETRAMTQVEAPECPGCRTRMQETKVAWWCSDCGYLML